MEPNKQSPAQLRNVFGANLRKLAESYASVSDLSRQLSINRTQFNRYLSGESFPRPDILARICSFFGVDARIMLEPIDSLTCPPDPFSCAYLRNFVGAGNRQVSQDDFPSGFYRFSRRSFVDPDRFVVSVVMVGREGEIPCCAALRQEKRCASRACPPVPDRVNSGAPSCARTRESPSSPRAVTQ
ncbi:helix-turn-helix domain-containing protein [Sulfitobacter porphyrae]|uniref:Helix-turn-helix domain-containing protein n=1 Tax=Sulfitobacter porphyrae TaxID=1246864 RepID=A0ABW2B2Z9_9RHOB